jgi:hypothetical protein
MPDRVGLGDLVAEFRRRLAPRLILEAMEPHQRMLADAPTRRRAVIASRRAGKSVACAMLAHSMCQHQAKRVLWLSITLTNIRRIAEDSMRFAVEAGGAAPVLNKGRWVYEYPTSSQIEIAGCNQTMEQVERYAGAGYDLIIIDEAGSIDPDTLDYLIDSVLWPALLDRQGVLVLVGTPRRNLAGRFHAVTSNPAEWPDWTVMRWNTGMNSHAKAQWDAEIASLTDEQRRLAHVRRELYGDWVDEVGTTWFHHQGIRREPSAPEGEWKRVLGVDFGFSDPNAFVVVGWRRHDTRLWILEASCEPGMLTSAIADRIRSIKLRWPGIQMVGDPAAAQTLADLAGLHGLPVVPADKRDVDGVVEAINDDAAMGRLAALPPAEPLLLEMAELDLVRRGNRLVPNPAKADHLCDAFRYAWRAAHHRLEEAAPPPESEGQRIDRLARAEAARIGSERRRRFGR